MENKPWMAPGLTEEERWALFMSRPADEQSFPVRVIARVEGVVRVAIPIGDAPRSGN